MIEPERRHLDTQGVASFEWRIRRSGMIVKKLLEKHGNGLPIKAPKFRKNFSDSTIELIQKATTAKEEIPSSGRHVQVLPAVRRGFFVGYLLSKELIPPSLQNAELDYPFGAYLKSAAKSSRDIEDTVKLAGLPSLARFQTLLPGSLLIGDFPENDVYEDRQVAYRAAIGFVAGIGVMYAESDEIKQLSKTRRLDLGAAQAMRDQRAALQALPTISESERNRTMPA